MEESDDHSGFFQCDGGVCICSICGEKAPSACQIHHADNCPVGLMTAVKTVTTVEDRVKNLEFAMAELDDKIEQLNKLLTKLGADLTALDEPR